MTALFREAGRAIQDMPFLLIQPMIVSTYKVAPYVRVLPDLDLFFLILHTFVPLSDTMFPNEADISVLPDIGIDYLVHESYLFY